ncbi:hypothetical protein L3Q82_021750, partial [Scortum barcoo]
MSPDCYKHSPKESTNTTPRVEEQVQSAAEADEELEMKDPRTAQPPDLAPAGGLPYNIKQSVRYHERKSDDGVNGCRGVTDSHPPVEPLPSHEEEEQTEEEDAENENIKAPVELIMEFLRSVMSKDLQLASRLCQMILIFEPDNLEASEFLPLIKKKLLEAEQEAEQSTEEEEEDEDDDEDDDNDKDNSESDEESSQSSSCSSSSHSSPSQSDEDEEEEKRGSRHK